jgi:hypothetical protein
MGKAAGNRPFAQVCLEMAVHCLQHEQRACQSALSFTYFIVKNLCKVGRFWNISARKGNSRGQCALSFFQFFLEQPHAQQAGAPFYKTAISLRLSHPLTHQDISRLEDFFSLLHSSRLTMFSKTGLVALLALAHAALGQVVDPGLIARLRSAPTHPDRINLLKDEQACVHGFPIIVVV